MYKSFTTEGGIRVPCILRYPPLLKPDSTQNPSIARAFATAMDIMPTIIDLAGITHPAAGCKDRQTASYRDRQVYGMTGKSWTNYLADPNAHSNAEAVYGANFSFGWELHGSAAFRQENWKIVFLPPKRPTGRGQWELFDLEKDPGEIFDMASKMPQKCKEMIKMFER